MKRNQKGFGAVEGLLILIIVLLVGFIGYYVYHTSNNANSSYSNATTSSNASQTAQKTASGAFVFKEIGVQMTLPASLKDLTYKAETITSVTGEKETAIYLSSTTFNADAEKCYNAKSDNATFGAMGKTAGQYPSDPTPQNTDGGLLKQFSDFYVSASYPNGITACTNPKVDPSMLQSEAHTLFNALSDAFKSTGALVQ